jgi:hypothetical protein
MNNHQDLQEKVKLTKMSQDLKLQLLIIIILNQVNYKAVKMKLFL